MAQHQIKQAKCAQNLQEEYKFTAQDDFQSNEWSPLASIGLADVHVT